jgi:hypothetical protein
MNAEIMSILETVVPVTGITYHQPHTYLHLFLFFNYK